MYKPYVKIEYAKGKHISCNMCNTDNRPLIEFTLGRQFGNSTQGTVTTMCRKCFIKTLVNIVKFYKKEVKGK